MSKRGVTKRRVAARARDRVHASLPPPRVGGNYTPLTTTQCQDIDRAARALMTEVGFLHAPAEVIDLVCAHGGLVQQQRLCFATNAIDAVLSDLKQRHAQGFLLAGQQPAYDVSLHGNAAFIGTGGGLTQAAPLVAEDEVLRPGHTQDIAKAAGLVQQLEQYAFFGVPLLARDIDDPVLQDVNAAYAALVGTQKHVITRAHSPRAVEQLHKLCCLIAGDAAHFSQRPFLSLNIHALAPPMRFDAKAVMVLLQAARCGFPVQVSTLSQRGASSSVNVASCIAQTLAETLASLILAYWVNPAAPLIFSPNAVTTDLRSGVIVSGSGEQALLSASLSAMGRYYGLITAAIAGMSNSMRADYQAGAEKAINVALCLQAGANMITHAGGTIGGGMALDWPSYVMDHDMVGAAYSSLRELDSSQISLPAMQQAITKQGNFLAQSETLQCMQSDFTYPNLFRRDTIDQHYLGQTAEQDAHQRLRDYQARYQECVAAGTSPAWGSEIDRTLRVRWPIAL